MNAAEKAANVREEARESKIIDMYREALIAYNRVRDDQRENRERLSKRKKMITHSHAYYEKQEAEWLKAIKLFSKCAKKGHLESIECLADMYYNGPYVCNWKKAFKYYKKGAELGSVICMHGLAECYERGRGVKSSYTLSEHWLKREEQEKNNQEEQ